MSINQIGGKYFSAIAASSNHLYWPLLDVDLAVESIRNPSLFPLVAKPVNRRKA